MLGHRKFNEFYPVKNCLFYRELIFDDDWNELNYSLMTRKDAETFLENHFPFAHTWRKKVWIFKKYSRVLFVTEILSVQLTLCEGDDFAPIVCSTRCRIYFRNSFHHLISLWDHLRLLLRPPDTPGHLSPELLIVLPPLLRGVHISGRLVIRIWKLMND